MANRKRQTRITLFRYDGNYYPSGSCVPHHPKLIVSATNKAEADAVIAATEEEWRQAGCDVHKTYFRKSVTLARNKARLVLCL